MYYLDPTKDLIFIKLFGTEANKDLLLSFLNSIMDLKDDQEIVDIDFTNPYHELPSYPRVSIVDVRCVDKAGKNYIVQIQVNLRSDFLEQFGHYNPWDYEFQLGKNNPDEKDLPVIFVGIADYTLFPDHNSYVNHYQFLDRINNICGSHYKEYYFVELKKFKKTVEELDDICDKWIYFLRYAGDYEILPQQLEQTPIVAKAFSVLERSRWLNRDLELYEMYVDSRRVEESVLKTAMNDERREIAKRMLSENFKIEFISEITGFSEREVLKLKKI